MMMTTTTMMTSSNLRNEWLAREPEVLGENLPSAASPQILHYFTQARTRAAAMGSRRLTTRATTRPVLWISLFKWMTSGGTCLRNLRLRSRGTHVLCTPPIGYHSASQAPVSLRLEGYGTGSCIPAEEHEDWCRMRYDDAAWFL
jgi:hypothetical protein